ncbi:MAG: hypothetical protein WBD22_09130, partial [Pyrinomonadaceae bacterium]
MKLFNILVMTFVVWAAAVSAQTEKFTYQGRLLDGTLPANARYDLQFELFEDESGGTAIGFKEHLGVHVSNGIFTVLLDFGGVSTFRGGDRWIEISVKPEGAGQYTLLNPRQQITSAPYSIRSLNAQNALDLGGVAADQ